MAITLGVHLCENADIDPQSVSVRVAGFCDVAVTRIEQKIAFAAGVKAHGNVRRAMREAGVASPSTAYRWFALIGQHGDVWIGVPQRRTREIFGEIAATVRTLSENNPQWGK